MLFRKATFMLLLAFQFFAETNVSAQEVFVAPPAKKLTTFPFVLLTGGIIIMKAKLDDFADSLNFILDTGSGGISLDSTTCAGLKIKTEMSTRTIRGIAGMKTVAFAYNHCLHLPGLTVDHLDFHINDYFVLTSVYGVKIDGIVGYSFLRNYIVSIDYDDLQLSIYSKGVFKYPHGGQLLHPLFNTLPMQEAALKDNITIDERFFFDTGAGMCMLLSDDFVKDSALLKKKRKLYTTQAEGLGGKKIMKMTVIKEVKVADYVFRKVPVYIFDDEFKVTSYPMLGGLLGNDLMRRFNTILNYNAQEIFIKPNKRYSDSFDYSYSGLGIYMIDNKVQIGDIMKGSPAEDAGFRVGDVVMAVDNDFSGNLQNYKTALQNINTDLEILVMRNNQPETLVIHIKSIE